MAPRTKGDLLKSPPKLHFPQICYFDWQFCYCEKYLAVTGLLRDDTYYEDDDVKEAIKRLPEDVYNARIFRIKRALDLSMKHQILPKEQWGKYEEVGDC